MKYKIITGGTLEALESNVQTYLKNGWSLQGSPFLDNYIYERYAQAVTYEDLWDDYDNIAGPNQ